MTVVEKHFEDLEGSSNMRMARNQGETKLSAGLLVTGMLGQQRCRAECPGWCERKACHCSGRQRVAFCAIGRHHGLLHVLNSLHVTARVDCQETL